jgi:CrcB protein
VVLWEWLVVGALGGGGAVLRFTVDSEIAVRAPGEFPWGTFVVNVSGAFALGVLAGARLTGDALLFAGTATLGSYTTFSTWMLETHRLGQDGDRRLALFNILVSLAAGLGAAALGRIVGTL